MTQHRLANDLKEAPMPASGRGLYSQALGGHMIGWGASVPAAAAGWAPGAMFVRTADPPALYINKGTATTSNFLLSVDGALLAAGDGVPVDATAGYAPGSLYIDTTTKKLYINGGTVESSAFTDTLNVTMSAEGEAIAVPALGGAMVQWGEAAPADAGAGYPPGALFIKTTATPTLYINVGTAESCNFDAIGLA